MKNEITSKKTNCRVALYCSAGCPCLFILLLSNDSILYSFASIAAAGIITFLSAWNNYLWPLIVLQTPENQTIPLLISNLGSSYSPDYGVIMTAIVLATLPTALIFFILQKHFVAGMLGSIK